MRRNKIDDEQNALAKSLRIALIGPGSIGGATAALLTRAGLDVEVVCKSTALAEKLRTSGMRLTGVCGNFTVPLRTVAAVSDLHGPKDLVILSTKATDMLEPARAVIPRMTTCASLLSFQNGICVDALADVVGRDRIVGCVIGWAATLHEPDLIEVTTKGRFILGAIAPGAILGLEEIRTILSHVMTTRLSTNIYGDLYSKLILNSCFNALCAITGSTLKTILASAHAKSIFVAVMREAMTVADAAGIKVEPFFNLLDYHRFLAGSGPWSRLKRDLFFRAIRRISGHSKPSTLQSLERGRKTEIDFLNGYIVTRAREHGIPVPVNKQLVELVHELENGKRTMGMENLNTIRLG